jgi:hypothetical protein
MNTSATSVPEGLSFSPPYWEKVGNFVVLLAYSGIVLFTVRYHEKWADEAQAWLLARDLDLKTLWFHELSYEGSPGLWHTILWVSQHVFHASYSSLGYIGVAFAIAGAALLIFTAPFPFYVRWPLAFTYFMVYQYAVIARPYTLLPLLCFAVALFFKDARRPVRMTIALVLLANLSLHGTILAVCFGLLYSLKALRSWRDFDGALRSRYLACAVVMALMFLFLFIVLKPMPDNAEFVLKHQMAQLPDPLKQQQHLAAPMNKLAAIVSGAFVDSFWLSAIFLMLTWTWCSTRGGFLILALPVTLLLVLYTMVHGYAHHHGTVFLATLTALWITWPSTEEQRSASVRSRVLLRGMIALLLGLCAINIRDAVVVIQREYHYPYSGAADAAAYLKAVGADHQRMYGLLFGINAVQAYFDHNIFLNISTTYIHLASPTMASELHPEELDRDRPEYIVAYSTDPQQLADQDGPLLRSMGYGMVHFSDGYYLYKRGVYQREAYLIFHRIHPSDERTPQPSGPDK